MHKFSNKLEPNYESSPFLQLLFSKMKELHPKETRMRDMPTADLVGVIILTKMFNHFLDDETLRELSVLYIATAGSTSHLMPPNVSTVELLSQLNN